MFGPTVMYIWYVINKVSMQCYISKCVSAKAFFVYMQTKQMSDASAEVFNTLKKVFYSYRLF